MPLSFLLFDHNHNLTFISLDLSDLCNISMCHSLCCSCLRVRHYCCRSRLSRGRRSWRSYCQNTPSSYTMWRRWRNPARPRQIKRTYHSRSPHRRHQRIKWSNSLASLTMPPCGGVFVMLSLCVAVDDDLVSAQWGPAPCLVTWKLLPWEVLLLPWKPPQDNQANCHSCAYWWLCDILVTCHNVS